MLPHIETNYEILYVIMSLCLFFNKISLKCLLLNKSINSYECAKKARETICFANIRVLINIKNKPFENVFVFLKTICFENIRVLELHKK